MNDPAAANAALTAFLRGVERRGAVFAHWQGGDADAGDAALAATLRAFRGMAGGLPFAEWPRRFWALLLAAPDLRAPAHADAAGVPRHVAGLGRGPRAALLLRLVAGLAESEAAAVLGIARPTYRLALRRALPHRADGSADPEAWRALSETAQREIRGVPQARLERIATLRDGGRVRAAASRGAAADAPARWRWPASLLVVALTAAALVATWWWPRAGAPTDAEAPRIHTEPLPPPAEPAARFDPAGALRQHRDLDLLLAQVSGDAEAFEDPAFDAWLAVALAQADGALLPPPETSEVDAHPPEQFDATR